MVSPFRYLLPIAAIVVGVNCEPADAEQVVVASAAAAGPPRFFLESREIHSTNLSQFKQWRDVMARWKQQRTDAMAPCADGMWNNCEPTEWADLVRELRDLPLREQVERVNSAFNRRPYVSSLQNWGEVNHWETPFEFLRKNGQCQDYAIAKFMMLRALGVPNEKLRLVVLRDTALGLEHAVAVASVNGEALILDNRIPHVVPVSQVHHYRPYYSTNETDWWLHTLDPPPRAERHRALKAAQPFPGFGVANRERNSPLG
jgi:predicted transglutaminase-like cysteine proteinase